MTYFLVKYRHNRIAGVSNKLLTRQDAEGLRNDLLKVGRSNGRPGPFTEVEVLEIHDPTIETFPGKRTPDAPNDDLWADWVVFGGEG